MKLSALFNLLLCLMLGVFLTACAKKEQAQSDAVIVADAVPSATANTENETSANAKIAAEDKLGTKWGDDLTSHVSKVNLSRVSDEPVAQAVLRYANKNFKGKAVNSVSVMAGKISFSVIDDRARTLPIKRDGKNYYVQAKDGQAYQLTYQNHSSNTYEIVASVDGLDVLNGQAASKYNAGYVLHPHQTLTIEGFRKSDSAVASFIFSKPEESYAANSSQGSIDNAGVIGTVVYALVDPKKSVNRDDQNEYAPAPNAFPGDQKN